MKNDIIIRNRGGLLAVIANTTGTFQLRGPKDALDIVQEAAPVLDAGDPLIEDDEIAGIVQSRKGRKSRKP